jgi:phosphopantothenoylcysteine decarboxylase/phosphopantothenate--cysteine ligase
LIQSFPRGREIVLGVGAGIAAYKSCDLLRRLKDHGFLVTVIPTSASLHFIGVATWEALSGRPVETELWNNVHKVPHIAAATRCDVILIAPTTADLLARLASGRADDYLTNVFISSDAPKILVPAMHPQMWLNPATQANVATLRQRGVIVVEPDVGRLTGDDSGIGRFPESARIISEVQETLHAKADLFGCNILITAGGTRERIDPVRYIGNRSSGLQGYALAWEAVRRGAKVKLLSANVALPDIEGLETFHIESAEQMQELILQFSPDADAIIMSAAVADARPVHHSVEKISKEHFTEIALTRNPDLLRGIVDAKSEGQVIVGFAAETGVDIEEKGRAKLVSKGVEILYVNDVSGGAIFGEEYTEGSLLIDDGRSIAVHHELKETLATILLDEVALKLGYVNE